MKIAIGRVIACFCIFSLVACSSFQPVRWDRDRAASKPALNTLIQVSDEIEITTNDKGTFQLKVTFVDENAIEGMVAGSETALRFSSQQIAIISKRQRDTERSNKLIAIIVAGVLAVLVVVGSSLSKTKTGT